mgnify:FL=1
MQAAEILDRTLQDLESKGESFVTEYREGQQTVTNYKTALCTVRKKLSESSMV